MIFKGSGFYITDYRSEGYKKSKSDVAKAAEGSTTKSETPKTETKPAPKPAAKKEA